MDAVTYFWLILKASFLSSAGVGNLPSLHQDLLARGWATEGQFARALAIGQLAPGPTGLWVVSLGYFTAGWEGVLLTATAIVVPPLLVLLVGHLHGRHGTHPFAVGVVRGLSLACAGAIPVVLVRVLAGYGLDPFAGLLAAATILAALSRRVPPIAVLAAAAAAGIAIYR